MSDGVRVIVDEHPVTVTVAEDAARLVVPEQVVRVVTVGVAGPPGADGADGTGSGGGAAQNVFFGPTEPTSTAPYLWVKTDGGGTVVDLRVGGAT